MKNIYLQFFLLLVSILYINSATSKSNLIIPGSMVVITTNDQPLQNIQYVNQILAKSRQILKIYNLDAVDEFEKKFSQGFPANEELAKKAFENKVNKLGKENFNKEIIKAYQGLMTAFQYEVERYPVIIFDQKIAVYGVTDLKVALQKYRNWQSKESGGDYE